MRTTPPRPAKPNATDAGFASLPFAPRANFTGTVVCVIGLVLTGITMQGSQPSSLARFTAVGVALSLAASAFADLRKGVRNLIRADFLGLAALYFLTLFEFLFKQEEFDSMTTPDLARQALIACLVGFGGIVIGRHIPTFRKQPFSELFVRPLPHGWLVVVFWLCFCLGFFHMLLAVEFDVQQLIYFFTAPRFSQPWARGKLGDWHALLSEFTLFLYLLPPLAGIIYARRRNFSVINLTLVIAGFLFALFYAFSSGTRNLFASYLVTFLIGYAFAVDRAKKRELIVLSAISVALLLVATVFMLQFRDIGMINYLRGVRQSSESETVKLYVDYNLYSIARLVDVFPHRQDYLGLEIPYQALIRPIPRALWPGKPEGLSSTIESALGVEDEGVSIAASFVGEAYMSGGLFAVLIIGTVFGILAGWWSHLASPNNSELGILIYASGFFAVVISMRSLFVFTTALLPTMAIVLLGSFMIRKVRTGKNQRRDAQIAAREAFAVKPRRIR